MLILFKATIISKKISDAVEKIGYLMCGIYAGLIFVLVFSGVILRVMGLSLSWSEELSRWMLISIAFISSSVALKKGQHVGVSVIIHSVPKYICKIFIIITDVIIIFFVSICMYYSFLVAIQAANQLGDIIQISMIYVKLHLPIGFLFMLIHSVYHLLAVIQTDDPHKFST